MQVFFTKKLHSLSRTMAFAFLALLNTGDISILRILKLRNERSKATYIQKKWIHSLLLYFLYEEKCNIERHLAFYVDIYLINNILAGVDVSF